LALLESCGGLLQNGITFLAMAAVLAPYSAWLPLILLASTLPALFIVLRFDRRYHRWWQKTTADRRRVQYYDMMLTSSHAAGEVRLFALGGYFQTAYRQLRGRLRSERLNQLKTQSRATLSASAIALLISGLAILWMVRRALMGLVTLGDLALFYQAFTKGQSLMRSLLGSLTQIYSNTLFLENLFEFLELKPAVKDPLLPAVAPASLVDGIRFQDVTFRYPGSEHDALRDFSLSIPAGKIVAIVGPNGAGKTTLLKLLCRFYDPNNGEIEIDGINIRDFAVEDVRRLTTVLFQIPMIYHETAGQSIAVGDLSAEPSQFEIEDAARRAGAHEFITRLPNGYDTQLGKWFSDGAELSGGEWQRIAMARAYVRQSPIIVLDEPTSFMDSWAEAEWFERFRELSQGRTGIIITHRFTIAMRADIIHVMNGGKIEESGSHQQLLSRGGLYSASWATQVQAAMNPTLGGAESAASGGLSSRS
jgi:ATP-binding cassette subfamily B protein